MDYCKCRHPVVYHYRESRVGQLIMNEPGCRGCDDSVPRTRCAGYEKDWELSDMMNCVLCKADVPPEEAGQSDQGVQGLLGRDGWFSGSMAHQSCIDLMMGKGLKYRNLLFPLVCEHCAYPVVMLVKAGSEEFLKWEHENGKHGDQCKFPEPGGILFNLRLKLSRKFRERMLRKRALLRNGRRDEILFDEARKEAEIKDQAIIDSRYNDAYAAAYHAFYEALKVPVAVDNHTTIKHYNYVPTAVIENALHKIATDYSHERIGMDAVMLEARQLAKQPIVLEGANL